MTNGKNALIVPGGASKLVDARKAHLPASMHAARAPGNSGSKMATSSVRNAPAPSAWRMGRSRNVTPAPALSPAASSRSEGTESASTRNTIPARGSSARSAAAAAPAETERTFGRSIKTSWCRPVMSNSAGIPITEESFADANSTSHRTAH